MKINGFVNGAYTLDSVNVDAQRCVNLYPEAIESGTGKGGQRGYLRNTPGLDLIGTVEENKAFQAIHEDSIGRTFVVCNNKVYRYSTNESHDFELWFNHMGTGTNEMIASWPFGNVNTSTDIITINGGALTDLTRIETGIPIYVSNLSGGTLPGGVSSGFYWIIVQSSTTFSLATSLSNALAGTKVDLTSQGTGNSYFIIANPDHDVILGTTNNNGFHHIICSKHIDYAENTIQLPANDTSSGAIPYLYEGMRVFLGSVGAPLPSSDLSVFTDTLGAENYFYVAPVSGNERKIKLYTSMQNIVDNNPVDLSPQGDAVTPVWDNSLKDDGEAHAFSTTQSGTLVGTPYTFLLEDTFVSIASSNTGFDASTAATLFHYGRYAEYLNNDKVGVTYDLATLISNDTIGTYFSLSGSGVAGGFSDFNLSKWIDGYFVMARAGESNFYVSDFNDPTVDPLSFAQAEGNPDAIIQIGVLNRDLWIFGEKSTEVFVNTGNADFPFERVQSGFFEIGCVATESVADSDGALFWLGSSDQGKNVVYISTGGAPQRISTHPIEQAINSYADTSTAKAFCYSEEGHKFYVLNFSEATWVYDLSTGLWHERAYLNAGTLEAHRVNRYAYHSKSNEHIVGDRSNGKLYKLSDTTYTDGSSTAYIKRIRSTPHISNENNYIFYDELFLDMQTGVGLISGQGSDPQVMLDWSDDGGNTWSDEAWTSAGGQAGGIGEYNTRVRWRRLGKSRDRIFRFSITDPVNVKLIDAYVKIRPGRS